MPGFSCITFFLAVAKTHFCPAKAVFDRFMWIMSDVNDCCACNIAHMLTEGETALSRALSLGLFIPGHFMRLVRQLSDHEDQSSEFEMLSTLI